MLAAIVRSLVVRVIRRRLPAGAVRIVDDAIAALTDPCVRIVLVALRLRWAESRGRDLRAWRLRRRLRHLQAKCEGLTVAPPYGKRCRAADVVAETLLSLPL